MDPIPLPPPVGGINQKVPKFSLQAPNCEQLINYNLTTTTCSTRLADGLFKEETTSPNIEIMAVASREEYTTDGCILVLTLNTSTKELRLWKVTTGGITLILSGGALPWTPTAFSTSFFRGNNYFFASDGVNQYSIKYDGAAVTALPYTLGGVGIFGFGGACVYKNRHYIPRPNTAICYFSGVDLISGVCEATDFSSLLSSNGFLLNVAAFTLADTVAAQEVIAFIFSSGDVLFYTGTSPKSSDWTKAGRAKIGRPYALDSGGEYQGDYVIANEQGVVSLRDLFLKGSEKAASLTVNGSVTVDWGNYAVRSPITSSTVVDVIFDKIKQRLMFSFPRSYWGDPRANTLAPYGITWFILGADSEEQLPWYLHSTRDALFVPHQCRRCVIWNNEIYYVTKRQQDITGIQLPGFRVIKKESLATNLYDVGSGIVAGGSPILFDYVSAPVANGRLYVQKCEGLDVFISSDINDNVAYSLIGDFGAVTSTGQTIPQTTTTNYKPFVNIGLEASFIQYRVSGETPGTNGLTGLTLSGVNFWEQMGGSPR